MYCSVARSAYFNVTPDQNNIHFFLFYTSSKQIKKAGSKTNQQ